MTESKTRTQLVVVIAFDPRCGLSESDVATPQQNTQLSWPKPGLRIDVSSYEAGPVEHAFGRKVDRLRSVVAAAATVVIVIQDDEPLDPQCASVISACNDVSKQIHILSEKQVSDAVQTEVDDLYENEMGAFYVQFGRSGFSEAIRRLFTQQAILVERQGHVPSSAQNDARAGRKARRWPSTS